MRHERFADAQACLEELRGSYTLALITNGASCLQREKLASAGLSDYFDVVVISAEFGVGKPDPSIFEHTLAQLRVTAHQTTMIGDSLTRDVDGAIAAGLRGIWLNRSDDQGPGDRPDLIEISTLS